MEHFVLKTSNSGTGFVLAHAYYPYELGSSGGDVHFDEDEAWEPNDQAVAR